MTAEIPSYQIHAVLQSLSRRLCGEQTAFADRYLSAERPATGSNKDRWLQTTIERVSDKIIDKITRLPTSTADLPAMNMKSESGKDPEAPTHPRTTPPMQFVFHRLDEDQHKQRCVIPIEEANFLITKKDR